MAVVRQLVIKMIFHRCAKLGPGSSSQRTLGCVKLTVRSNKAQYLVQRIPSAICVGFLP